MKKRIYIAVSLFLLTAFLLSHNLNKPFYGEHDWNGVRYGNIARNYLRYGLLNTKLGQIENSGYVESKQFSYLTHYPPLLPILISLNYKLFGISEWSTRFISLLATSGTILLIFLIGLHIWDIRKGLVASLLALATPLVLYFGKNPSHEALAVFFILLSFWGFLKYQKNGQRGFKLIFLFGLVMAQATTWVGYFLLPALTITLFLRKEFKQIKKLIPFWILSLIMFTVHFIHVAVLTGSVFGGNLLESLLQRSGILSEVQPSQFNLINYLGKTRLWFSTLFTNTLGFLVVIWLINKRFNIKDDNWPIFCLGLIGLIYAILFSNALFIHNYLVFYFLPFVSLAASAGIFHISQEIQKRSNYLTSFRWVRHFSLILIVIFLAATFYERKSYLDALIRSDADKLAVEIGRAINRQTLPNDIVLVSPLKFSYSAENFLKFYSDRKLIFADTAQLNYDYIVTVDSDLGVFRLEKR